MYLCVIYNFILFELQPSRLPHYFPLADVPAQFHQGRIFWQFSDEDYVFRCGRKCHQESFEKESCLKSKEFHVISLNKKT
jgi:hypothetical protein